MGLESGDFIDDLDPTWPLGTDFKSQGDDHIRLLKHVLQTQFPNLGDAVVVPSAAQINAFPTIAGFKDNGLTALITDDYGNDCDEVLVNSQYIVFNTTINIPPQGAPSDSVLVTRMTSASDASGLQYYWPIFSPLSGNTWIRHRVGSAWAAWQLITETGGSSLLVGEVKIWPTATAPAGHLHCNGDALDTTTYAALFAVLGYDYGGSGASFNIPDYRGYFMRGQDAGAGNDPDRATRTDRGDGTGGDSYGSKQATENNSHAHAAAGDHSHANAGSHQHASAGDHGHTSAGAHQHPGVADHFHNLDRFESGSAIGVSYVQTDDDDSETPSQLDTPTALGGAHQHDSAGAHVHPNAGAHQHTATGDHGHAAAGDHSHAAAGGAESRPVNINVNYMIRF